MSNFVNVLIPTPLVPRQQSGIPPLLLENQFFAQGIEHKFFNHLIMFIASFSQTSSDKFTANRHGEPPMIGTVAAGKYHNSIIDGTVFAQRGLIEGQLYLAHNVVATNPETKEILKDKEGNTLYNVEIISKVSPVELIQSMKELGKPFRLGPVVDSTPEDKTLSNVLTNGEPVKSGITNENEDI